MPELFQVIEDEAEYVLVIEEQKRRRPNSPGTSKRQHFPRANQKRSRKDFDWHAPTPSTSQKSGSSEEGRHQAEERFTRSAAKSEPRIEPPRPEGWKPLVPTPQLVQLSEEGIRKLAYERMKEWSKDQEEYTVGQFREIEEKKAALKSPTDTLEEIERTEVEKRPALKFPRVTMIVEKTKEEKEAALKRAETSRRLKDEFERASLQARVMMTRSRKELTKEDLEYLDAREEEERLRHERSLEIERQNREKAL
jgi:hypothetical protein